MFGTVIWCKWPYLVYDQTHAHALTFPLWALLACRHWHLLAVSLSKASQHCWLWPVWSRPQGEHSWWCTAEILHRPDHFISLRSSGSMAATRGCTFVDSLHQKMQPLRWDAALEYCTTTRVYHSSHTLLFRIFRVMCATLMQQCHICKVAM